MSQTRTIEDEIVAQYFRKDGNFYLKDTPLTLDDLIRIKKLLVKSEFIKSITLKNCNLNNNSAAEILEIIRKNSRVMKVNLSKNHISTELNSDIRDAVLANQKLAPEQTARKKPAPSFSQLQKFHGWLFERRSYTQLKDDSVDSAAKPAI